ncbi:Hypothetical protein, putative [Bodo saltans]|uniref:Uncharacterized protein n=1 Tax=Bodo saltans TaxID=75058 RepID=A0A0S4ISV3_BODSA|nr:Hypothetical protein, putative [Bodo saltans]|eukprot:CUF69773.1 Hypothetical protein, putative [Bodo saltans]
MQCPETMALALDALCSYVEVHHRTWLKPLVINTHGWIQSSGRRSTVEALRRLHPQHVVQLMRHGDPKWVMPEVIFEPNCGLNRRVVSDRFLAGIPTCMPEAQGRRNAAEQEGSNTSANINAPQMEVHSLTVVRLDTVYKTADSRKDNWRRYFYPLTASSAPTATSMLDIALPPGNGEADELPVLVLPHDLVGGASLEEFIGATAQSVVALCCASSSSLSSSSQLLRKFPKKRDREAAAVKDAVVRPQEAIHGAQFLCYGFVVSSWSQQVHTTSSPPRSLRVAVPLRQSSLTSLLARYSAAEPQRLVVYACPYEAFDTSFLVPQQTKTTK